MRDLIAFDLPAGPEFVDALRAVWDAGDAALPLDPRTPLGHRSAVVAAMRPAAVLTSGGERTALPDGVPIEEGDALVVTTSGTTGEPKGAVHTHRSIEYAAFATSIAAGIVADACWLACLPLSHVGGLSVVTRALLTATPLVVHDRVDPDAIDAAQRDGATHVSLVPTALARIDATPWHTILLGGSAIPADRPSNCIATYGMTETFGGVIYDGLALNGIEMRIASTRAGTRSTAIATTTETGAAADGDGSGPIELRSPTLLRAYRDGTDPLDSQGWFRTGDLGSIDARSGLLTVHGRADDMIISGGEKVWPGPVEDLLMTDPRVREVAVVGRPDAEWGERVVAIVVAEDSSNPPQLDGLRWLVREHLPISAAPKELELVDSLPRTALGKIRRTLLAVEQVETGHDG